MAELVEDLHDPSIIANLLQDELLLPSEQANTELQFPNVFTDAIDFESTAAQIRQYTESATFRAWNTENEIGKRRTPIKISGELPPLGRKYPLFEKDILRMNAGQIPQSVRTSTFDDVRSGLQSLRIRLEIARMQALITGALSIAENGVQLDVDFGRNANRETTVGTLWSVAATATPIADELGVLQLIEDDTGVRPDVAYASTDVINALLLTDDYRNAYPTVRVMDRLSLSQLNEVRSTSDLPPLVRYNTKYGDSGTRVLAADTIVHATTSRVGATVWGVPAMASEAGVQWAAEVGGPIAYQMKEYSPLRVWTEVEGIALPVLANPDMTAATVVL